MPAPSRPADAFEHPAADTPVKRQHHVPLLARGLDQELERGVAREAHLGAAASAPAALVEHAHGLSASPPW
jgi:hypothetical protein